MNSSKNKIQGSSFMKLLLMPTLLFTIGSAFSLIPIESKLIDSVAKHKKNEIAFIEKTVNMNSGTLNLEGVKAVTDVYKNELEALGFKTSWIEMPTLMNRAGHLFAFHSGSEQGKRILLIGHLDTVFSKESPFQKFNRNGNIATGPGVTDMKGGNAVILYALKALKENGQLDKANITVALLGDEESSGIPAAISRETLINAANYNDLALAFESAKTLSSIVTQRRGLVSWELHINAKAGHSSLIFTPEFGVGAILGSAHILERMFTLSQQYPYITFNPGIIAGGNTVNFVPDIIKAEATNKINIIPQKAISSGEIRFLSQESLDSFIKVIQQEIACLTPPVTGHFEILQKGKPSMEPTHASIALFNEVKAVNETLNLGPLSQDSPLERGAADISYVADRIPSLDGLGAIGNNEHSDQEYMDINATMMATQRATLLLYRLIQTH